MKIQTNFWKWVYPALFILFVLLVIARFFHLSADFPTDITSCRALYSDEGWYAGNVISCFLTGDWYVPDEMNSFVSLPVLQLFHFISFFIFGPTIVAARLTILVFFVGIVALTYLLVRQYADRRIALVSLVFLVANYYSFAYSRFAIAEFPMTFFALLSVYLLLKAREGHVLFFTFLSSLSFMTGVLTKTSGVFIFPVLVYIFWRHWKQGVQLKGAAPLFVGVSGVIFLGYLFLLVFPYYQDYMFFYELNIGIEVDYSPAFLFNNARRVLRRLRYADRLFIPFLVIAGIYLSVKSRKFRRHPLLHISVLWLIFYLSQLFAYSRNVPRYYLPVYPVLSILTGLVFLHFFQNSRFCWQRKVFVLVLVVSLAVNIFRISSYIYHPSYSFEEMAEDIARHMESGSASNEYLLGYCSATVSLHNQKMYLNDLFTPTPLEEKIKQYEPQYYLTEGADFDWIKEDYPEVFSILKEFYSLEKIARYDVYQNEPTGRPLSFYRLNPR